ncbi:hypothetical protein DAPK24_007000 [Pichia kluyveri]|uniref:Uncharacterized protein n=1 Tax=Pichia kluyveri TaxID=36015 RepID=A0AAV5QY90_PICKL|nr:hypothetical protein DAPK24_007000 [Pichia kluyveri]
MELIRKIPNFFISNNKKEEEQVEDIIESDATEIIEENDNIITKPMNYPLEENYNNDNEIIRFYIEYNKSKNNESEKFKEFEKIYNLKKTIENYINMIEIIDKIERKHNKQLNNVFKKRNKGPKTDNKILLLDKKYQKLIIQNSIVNNECNELRNENKELREKIEEIDQGNKIGKRLELNNFSI